MSDCCEYYRDFTKRVSLPKNKHGQIMVDSHLRVLGESTGRVYALGDCAQIEGHALPCTAQVAERQGRYLARALCHQPTPGRPEPEPFVYKPWGMLAYVGGYQALHDTPYDKSHG